MTAGAVIEPLFEEAVVADQVPAIAGASTSARHTERSAVGEAEVHTRPVSGTTPFRAYSVAKPFTALAVIELSRNGAFNLDDLANDHLELLDVVDTAGQPAPVSIRHLLTHTAPIEPALMSSGLAGCPRRFTELVNGHISCVGTPGEDWAYSNEGYGVLQQLVEEIADSDFCDHMNRLLRGLGVEDGGFFEPPGPANAATGYDRGPDGAWNTSPDVYPPLAAGGLWLSSQDQERLITNFARRDHSLVDAFEAATQPQVPMPMPELTMGLGFMLRRHEDRTYAWHSGASLGGYAELWLGAHQSLSFCANASVDLGALAQRALDLLASRSS